jgi:hypothetical protein
MKACAHPPRVWAEKEGGFTNNKTGVGGWGSGGLGDHAATGSREYPRAPEASIAIQCSGTARRVDLTTVRVERSLFGLRHHRREFGNLYSTVYSTVYSAVYSECIAKQVQCIVSTVCSTVQSTYSIVSTVYPG